MSKKVAHADTSDAFRAVNGGAEHHETTLELTYSSQLTDNIRIQPDIQYIKNPGVTSSLENALVIGVRFELSL